MMNSHTSRTTLQHRITATALLVALVYSPIAVAGQATPPAASSRRSAVAAAVTPRELPFFGPQKYVRTTGTKDVYTATINVPAWLASPFRLHVDNGNADGTNRVSSATIEINGTTVLSQSDFNQNAATFDRTVTLTPSTTLTVTLTSTPASFLTINLFGTSADYTAPRLVWAQPVPSSTVNTATPRLLVQYGDSIGTNEPAAAGVDLDTLKISIDDVDRTSLFTRRSDEASAQIPATLALAPGRHTFKASISDLAANRTDISGDFRVDLVVPSISIVEPAPASYLATRNPVIRVRYQDESALNLQSLRVTLNGNDVTSLFTRGDLEAIVVWPAGTVLPEGLNQLTAKIQDLGGNEATATVAFSVDIKPPVIAIAQPASGGRFGSRDLGVTITWSDDQGLAINTATATIDGNAVTLTRTNTQATAQLTGLTDSIHTLIARVADRAGNASTATSTFTVDTTVPKIEVVEPPAGAKIKTNTPNVRIEYSDDQGVDVASFKASINSIDRTSLFIKSNASAAATISGFSLPEGMNEIAAEIRDVTANLGRTISNFLVDTVAPAGTIDAPADRVTTSTPVATIRYSDSGSGIDPTSVHLFVDAADRSSLVTATTDVASATLLPLAEGTHEVKFTFGDQAGNLTTRAKSFVVDTRPPQLSVAVPANDSFINSSVPALRITYSDPLGTGVNLQSFALTLQKSSEPAVNIVSYVTAGPLEAVGIVPDASKLADGTYHLRAQISDIAGNLSTSEVSFEVDTVAPTYRVESPAPNGYVATTTPQFTIRYDDELSGVDTSRAVVLIDGIDKTARFTFVDGVATGTLLPNEALGQGRHTIEVSLFDRAGNKAPSTPQSFTVDTIAPTAAVEAPIPGSYVGKVPHNFAVTYSDGNGSGVDPASVKVTIDGIDRTAEFTIGAARATASVTTQLADGSHTLVVSILDWAGNSASASSTFKVDATNPVVTITAPAAGVWLKGPTINVTGSVADASPTSVEVNGLLASLTTGNFSISVPAGDGSFTVHAVARDAAGNVGTADVTVNVDSAPPVITVTEPVAGFVTKNSSAHLAGRVTDASAVTMTLNGQSLTLAANLFGTDVQLTNEGANVFTLAATDAAGNSSSTQVTITRDTIAPTITVASPVKSSVIGTVPVVVRGTYVDATAITITVDGVAATITGDAWQASVSGLAEGQHTFSVVATDAAGNVTTTAHDVTIDLNAPVVTITAPLNGALTKDPTSTITGTAVDVSLVSVKSGSVEGTLEAGANANEKKFTIAGVQLTEGDNTLHVVATDALSRATDKTVLVTRDSTVPVVTVTGPDQITRSRPAHLVVTATDNLAVKDIVFKLGTTELTRLTASPYAYDFSAPTTAAVGDTLTITITATDTAGNTATVSKAIRLVAEGAIAGQVLSDVNGQPLRGARVRLSGSASQETLTDERGRYAFPVNDQNVVLTIDSVIGGVPTTIVERVVGIQSGVGTVPVDARLVALGPRVFIPSTGGQLASSNVLVSIPSGAFATSTGVRLTLLSPQALPNLLPLGWSPVAAFDVFAEGALAAPLPFSAAVSSMALVPSAHLLFYNTATHVWTMSQAGVTATNGTYQLSLPVPGTYVLAVTDGNNVPIAVSGETVRGVEMVPIPDTATSTGEVTPPTLPPTGGSAIGKLIVKSATPLPSGTVVQAEIIETFSLANGETASEETRTEDLVLYRGGADLVASFPIVPSRTFAGNNLLEGKVHLDILAGREAIRGKTGGGNQGITLTAGAVNVTVPAGSLPNDVAIVATPTILSSFLPTSPSAVPFAEVVLDFSGFTLATSGQLSASAVTLSASETAVIARVERVNGVPKVVIVAAADRNGDRVISRELTGFAGIRTGGRYVFYRIGVPWSTVAGTVGLAFGSSAALVQVDGLPFVAITNDAGQFNAIAPVGTAHLTASVPGTSLTGSTSVSVVAGQTATASFGIAATLTVATATPANGAIRVPVSAQIEISASAPLNPATVNLITVQLRKVNSGLVPASYVFSGSGRVLAVVPTASLEPGESYTLTVNGLADVYGGAVNIAPVTFTTQADTPPSYDTNRIVFTMPDANGLTSVSAPAGSLPAGTRVLIVNSGNGIVVSLTVANDGSFSGSLPATIDDRLLITVTDPKGNVLNFERSKFVFTDGSGRVAIGSAGGTVEGTNGTGIIIPDGALDAGAVFKVESFGPERFPERPAFDEAHFGSGLTITSEQMPKLRHEGKLVFPRPADAPEGAFFYVFKRMTGPNGRVEFETIDIAYPNAEGKVVTASYPHIGWTDSVGTWQDTANAQQVGFGLVAQVVYNMMWTFDALHPGLPTPGVIGGKAYQIVYKPGALEPVYEGIGGAKIQALDSDGNLKNVFARSQSDGTFTVWDPQYRGGLVKVHATVEGARNAVDTTAFEANPIDSRQWMHVLLQRYLHVANVDVTFNIDTPPPAPDVSVHVMTLTADMVRKETTGIVVAGVPLIIGFKLENGVQGEVVSATINDDDEPVRRDDSSLGRGLPMDFRLSSAWVPTAAGTYVIRAIVMNPLGGPALTVEHTLLVIASGGNNARRIEGQAPDWITKKLVPKPNQIGVPADVLIQVVFTEPVTNVANGLQFSPAHILSGTGVDDLGNFYAIADMHAVPDNVRVAAITIRPIGGLDFNKQYVVKFTDAIQDTDQVPGPRSFSARELKFTTIKPQPLGGTEEKFGSPGMVVLNDYAYVARREPDGINGFMTVYSLDDVEEPVEVARRAVSGQPMDISGEAKNVANNGNDAILIGSGLKLVIPGPSNLYLFDVQKPEDPQRIAAVSLTESAEDGTILKTFLRKTFGYTITYPRGIQIVDLQRAIREYTNANADPVARLNRDRALVTPGVGFGQTAVVSSTRVNGPGGFLAHLLDLQAGDYMIGGATHTLVYATGTVPLAIVDQLDPNNPRTPAIGGASSGSITFGRNIALTKIDNRNVAVMIGTGSGKTNGTGDVVSGSALCVVDLTDPLAPTVIGSFAFGSSNLTDLAVRDTTAVVADGAKATVLSLADPTKPRKVGVIDSVGARIAINDNGGLLLSTDLDKARPLSGVQIALLKPVVIVKKVEPLMIDVPETDGDVDNPQKVRALEVVTVKVKVIPDTDIIDGKAAVTNILFQNSSGVTPMGGDHGPYEITFTSASEGNFTLPKNEQYEDTELRAIATVETESYGTLTSIPRRIKLGWVKLTLDSNNNTIIDPTDDEAKRKGRAFAFWESDPDAVLKTETLDDLDDDKLKGLADYATVHITVNKAWWLVPGLEDAEVRVRIKHVGDPAEWQMVRKMAGGTDYLSRREDATTQRAEIVGTTKTIPTCSPSGDRLYAEQTECGANGGYITLPKLNVGSFEYLFRCKKCNGNTANLIDVPKMTLEFVPSNNFVTYFDRAKADIRPFKNWMTVMSARTARNTTYKPQGVLKVPEDEADKWANRNWQNDTAIPPTAEKVTVLVHGYNVPHSDAANKFFPAYLKRLYWAGHPVLRLQGEWRKKDEEPSCVKNCAHTIGISWPSDDAGTKWYDRVIGAVPKLPLIGKLSEKYASMRFPADEHHAFGTGPPLAAYLKKVRDERSSRSISVIAHSLGNLAVNSAIYRWDVEYGNSPPHVIDKYIMNEAAMPAEAMALTYTPSQDELRLWDQDHAANYGHPDDQRWYADWDILTSQTKYQDWLDTVDDMKKQGAQISGRMLNIDPREMYRRRWTQVRPFPLPDYVQNVIEKERGPWSGLFARNKDRTRIFNTYSEDDRVVGVIWRVNQVMLKPLNLGGATADPATWANIAKEIATVIAKMDDAELAIIESKLGQKGFIEGVLDRIPNPDMTTQDGWGHQTWGLTKYTSAEESTVFNGLPTGFYWTTLRQWAELSFWFPSTSFGAGVRELKSVLGHDCNVDPCNMDFTPYSGAVEPIPAEGLAGNPFKSLAWAAQKQNLRTHSYLAYGRLFEIWPAYQELKKILDPKN